MKDYRQANRGMPFEELVRYANEVYRRTGEAMVQKIPTEFIPIRNYKGQVCNVKVEHKSTVDFLGRVKNRPIAIETKHTSTDSIRYAEVEDHQDAYLMDFARNGDGISIVLVSFKLERFFAVPAVFWHEARDAWKTERKSKRTVEFEGETWTTNGKASCKIEDLLPEWEVTMGGRYGLDYLVRYL